MEAVVAEVTPYFFISALVVFLALSVYALIKDNPWIFLAGGAVLITSLIHLGVVQDSAKNEIYNRVEATYGFEFEDDDDSEWRSEFPLGTEPDHGSFVAYLDDVPGKSVCLVEITEDSMYRITCNGEVREPRV